MNSSEFQAFPKITRWSREWIITEKIDGTNAQVIVGEDGSVMAGSRNRIVTPESDNYGFASWVHDNADQLRELGPGRHYGEWWGRGVNRAYGQNGRHFSLFNVSRWAEGCPACCRVVPTMWRGIDVSEGIANSMRILREAGSIAVQGFMRPEGIVIFHTPSGSLFKMTIEHDESPKGAKR